MPLTLPHTFHDGVSETASGVQVMDNFNALKTAIEAVETLLGGFKIRGGTFTTAAFDGVASRSRYAGNIPHGLGAVPKAALVTAHPIAIQENGGGVSEAVAVSVASYDGTNVAVVATALGTTNNATVLEWLVIG